MARSSGKRAPALKTFFYVGTIAIFVAMAGYLIGALTGLVPAFTASVDFTVLFSLSLSFMVVSYLLHKGRKPKQIVRELGLSRASLTWKMVGIGLLLFAIYLLILVVIAGISYFTGTTISSNVQQTIGGYPIWALVFISVVAPLNEEIAFRGFLVPRIGIVPSGLLFAVLHLGYGSISEIAVALWFGLSGGYVFKKTKSLYPSLMTHVMVNTITSITLIAMVATLVH